MEWDAYLTQLSDDDRIRAEDLAVRFGLELAISRVRIHPITSLDQLEQSLQRYSARVRRQVTGLYESIDVHTCPAGWTITNREQTEPDGTRLIQSDVIGPNGARGFFERGYNAGHRRIDLRNAFLRLRGATEELPTWVTGAGVPMVESRGIPTVQYFTFYQLKLLNVPAGLIRCWRRVLFRFGLRPGPFATAGRVASIEMCTIQNVDTIIHLHWLSRQFPASDLAELLPHTSSVEYSETTAVQCGYKLVNTSYLSTDAWESEIGPLLQHFEDGNPTRIAENDSLLTRFSFDRHTIMKQNFGISLAVLPN